MLSVTAIAGAQEPITILKQGHFSVGGTTIQRQGAYDNSKFVGWAEQEETGQLPYLRQMCKFFLVMILQNLIILMIKTIDFSHFCLSLRNKTKNYEKFH